MSTNPDGGRTPDAKPSESERSPRLEVTGTQVLASGLASFTAAIVSSFFGVAGTFIGAAVMGVVITTGNALYNFVFRRTRHRLKQVQTTGLPAAWTRPKRTGETETETETPPGTSPEDSSDDESTVSRWRTWLSQRRWGVATGLAIVLVGSLLAITATELIGQQSLAGIVGDDQSGRTSVGSLFGDDDNDEPDHDDNDQTDDSEQPGTTTTTRPSDPGTEPDETTTTTRSDSRTTTTRAPERPTTTTTAPPEAPAPERPDRADEPDGAGEPPTAAEAPASGPEPDTPGFLLADPNVLG